jgi:multiple sugar transport system substrate-binding protein
MPDQNTPVSPNLPFQPPQPAAAAPMSTPPVGTSTIATQPKKGFPKIILFVLVFVVILGLIGFVVSKLLIPSVNENREVTLSWWGLWEDNAVMEPLIAEYQTLHPNVKIKYESQSRQDYRERLTNALASGNGPDIFRFHNSWVPMFSRQLDALPADVMSPAEFQSTYYPVITSDLTTREGKVVGLPLGIDSIALFVNDEIFDTYLKTAPTNWDEFADLARELTIKDEQGVIRQSGAAIGTTANLDHWPEIIGMLMLQNKVNMSTPTGTRAEQALDFFTRFTKVYKVWDDRLPNSTIAFAAGKVAMYFGPSWRVHEVKQQNPNLKFRVLPVPQLRKETGEEPNVYYATYWVEGVSAESKAKKESWEFLKFLSTQESLQKFYTSASATRAFGEPYPRIDMQNMIATDPLAGAFVQQARESKSWFLASRTYDGPTGINTQLNKYFEDAINAINEGQEPQGVLTTVAQGVIQVLSRFGLATAPQATP